MMELRGGEGLAATVVQLIGGVTLMLSAYRFLAPTTNALLAAWIEKRLHLADGEASAPLARRIKSWATGTFPAAVLSVSRDSFGERLLSGTMHTQRGRSDEGAISAGKLLAMNLATWLWLLPASLLTILPSRSTLPALVLLAAGLLVRLRNHKRDQKTGTLLSSTGLMLLGMAFIVEAVPALLYHAPADLNQIGTVPVLMTGALLFALLGALRGGSITAGPLILAAAAAGLLNLYSAVFLLGSSWLGRSLASRHRHAFMTAGLKPEGDLAMAAAIWFGLPLVLVLLTSSHELPASAQLQAALTLPLFFGFILLEAALLALAAYTKRRSTGRPETVRKSGRCGRQSGAGLLEYLSAEDFAVCRKPELLNGNLSIVRSLIADSIGLTVDLLMELLNASQLPDEAKEIRRHIHSGYEQITQQSRLLEAALSACTPSASNGQRLAELGSCSGCLQQIGSIAGACDAIGKSLAKHAKKSGTAGADGSMDLFAQISQILDLLHYVQDFAEGFSCSDSMPVLREMDSAIKDLRDSFKKQTILLMETRKDSNLKAELAFIEINDRLLHIADAGLELYRLLGGKTF